MLDNALVGQALTRLADELAYKILSSLGNIYTAGEFKSLLKFSNIFHHFFLILIEEGRVTVVHLVDEYTNCPIIVAGANTKRIVEGLREGAGDVLVFPEMFCSGYTRDRDLMKAEKLMDTIVKDVSKLSQAKGSTVICGCPLIREDGLRDSAIVIDGYELAEYDKMVMDSGGLFDDSEVFVPGNRPMIVERQGLRMALAVGRDIADDGLMRRYACDGADMLICISALTSAQMDRFLITARAVAAKYSMPVMVCNMTGPDPGTEMGGRSAFIGTDGEFLETCTTGSDVREIRIDVDALKEATAARKVPAVADIGEGSVYAVKAVEPDPSAVEKCPFFG